MAGEMVERVARAIDPFAWEWIDFTQANNPTHMALQRTIEHQLQQARAAIVAMREPTDAMVEAGNYDAFPDGHGCGPIASAWREMIDEALK